MMQQFRVFVRGLIVTVGAAMTVVGLFAMVGLVFMYAAGLFGHPITWWQGTVVAVVIKLVGTLLVPATKAKR